jgi:hypothetical protein
MSRLRQVWRAVRSFAALAAGVAFTLQTASASDSVTIVLSAQQNASSLSIAVLEQELAAIPDLDLEVSWLRSENLATGIELDNPVQVRLMGRCNLTGFPDKASRQPGPYAWAHVSDGRVLPFIDVDCDRIRTALFSTMWGEDFQHRDFLLGRALARIIAHELHHVVHSEVHHSDEGLAQPRLTAASLIRGDARLYSGINND